MDLHHKKSEYTNIPVAVSLLHIKEYANLLKIKERHGRRTSSESNSICTTESPTVSYVKPKHLTIKIVRSSIEEAGQPIASIHMSR